jgi:hypothetical protein
MLGLVDFGTKRTKLSNQLGFYPPSLGERRFFLTGKKSKIYTQIE